VRGEHDVAAELRDPLLQGRASKLCRLQELEPGEHRVALVEVIDLGIHAERLHQAHAADAEHDLLGQPILGPPAVQALGDPPVRLALGLQEVEVRCDVPLDLPGPEGDAFALHRDLDTRFDAAHRVALGLRILVFQASLGSQDLLRVSLVPEQTYTRHGGAEVADRLHVVPGEDAEATGIDRKRGVEAVLHAEVRDAGTGGHPPDLARFGEVLASRPALPNST